MHALRVQVGVDMGAFRAFPYRGSLLRFQSGAVQEVFHEPMSAKVVGACMLLWQINLIFSVPFH